MRSFMYSFKKRSLALLRAVLFCITTLTSILPVASFAEEPEGTTYVLTDTLVGGKDYLIATENNGSLYVLNSSMTGTAKKAVNGKITVTDSEADLIVFNCIQADPSDAYSTQLKLGDKYLYAASGNNNGFAFG